MIEPNQSLKELQRVKKVSDLLCTGHAMKADELSRLALGLDLSLLTVSAWLVAVSFLDERLATRLTPFDINPQLWTGLLGFAAFILSLIQLRVDWKGQADAHRRSCDLYAEVKRDIGYLLANGDLADDDIRRSFTKYDMASASSVPISEKDFLRIKRGHHLKLEVSRLIDAKPSASIILLKIRLWIRDNK